MENAVAVADRIHSLLVEEEDPRVCREIPDEACDAQPRAFFAQLAAQTLTKLGDALTSSRRVLAWMLSAIGSPPILISLLVSLRESLSLLPQLFATAFATPYIVVLIQRAGNGDATSLAVLLFAEGAAGLLSGPFWGRWADTASHRVMAAAAALAGAVITLTLLSFHAAPAFIAHPVGGALLLFTAAIAHHGARVGRKTYLVNMATSENRSQYTAVSNTALGLFLLCGAGLGVLDAHFGTSSVLVLLLVTALAAIRRCRALPAVD